MVLDALFMRLQVLLAGEGDNHKIILGECHGLVSHHRWRIGIVNRRELDIVGRCRRLAPRERRRNRDQSDAERELNRVF
jgi:hypothetical protein